MNINQADILEGNISKDIMDILLRDNTYYGCRLEIGHLISFLKKLLWFNQSNGTYPAGMSQDDYNLMIEIFRRYNPNLERKYT